MRLGPAKDCCSGHECSSMQRKRQSTKKPAGPGNDSNERLTWNSFYAKASITISSVLSMARLEHGLTCTEAMRGGRRRPPSSPCVMMTPPIMRVLMPKLLWCGCRSEPDSSRNCVSKARAKLSPRLWLVPACARGRNFVQG